MNKLQQLKKINFLSLIGLILVLSFLLTIPTYYIIYQNYKNEIENIKKEYIQTQKSLMQNQVNNLIHFIETTRQEKFEKTKVKLKSTNLAISIPFYTSFQLFPFSYSHTSHHFKPQIS
jgi:flagellar biosynthesis protein FliP